MYCQVFSLEKKVPVLDRPEFLEFNLWAQNCADTQVHRESSEEQTSGIRSLSYWWFLS